MSTFLVPSDYRKQIREEIFIVISQNDDTEILTAAEETAIQLARSYLSLRAYDVDKIFALTDKDRPALLVTYLVDIVLYILYSAHASQTVPQLRADRYAEAVDWLQRVSEGRTEPDLPYFVQDDPDAPENHLTRLSPGKKTDHDW